MKIIYGILIAVLMSNTCLANTQSVVTVKNVTGTYNNTQTSTLLFDDTTGFVLSNPTPGTTEIALGSSFKNWEVTGQPTLVAVGEDTVQFVAGTNMVITTNNSSNPKTITLNAASSGSGTVTQVNTSSPLTGGPLTTTGTIGISQAGTSTNGYLSSTDWNTFNGKQASGSYLTALTGDGTASGPGSAALTLATVNANTGSFGSSTAIPNFTVNGKGLITAAGTNPVIAPAGTLTGTTLASGVTASSLTSVGTLSALLISGNVGINSLTPGQKLDIQGTARMTGFTLSSSPISGYVLTSDSSGNGSWQPAAGGNIGIGTANTVTLWGAGNTLSSSNNLIFLNGNLGVGSSTPNYTVTVNGSISTNSYHFNSSTIQLTGQSGVFMDPTGGGNVMGIYPTGNVGIGTTVPAQLLDVKGTINATQFIGGGVGLTGVTANPAGSPTYVQFNSSGVTGGDSGFVYKSGNVGISSVNPGQRLDVGGTVRMTGLVMPTGGSVGYLMTSDANGVGTWIAPSGAAGSLWALQNVTDQSLAGGNVGIGTTFTTTSALTVMNGNVGIGTWIPNKLLDIGTNHLFTVDNTGAIVAASQTLNGNLTFNSGSVNLASGAVSVGATGFNSNAASNNSAFSSANNGISSGNLFSGSSSSMTSGNMAKFSTTAPAFTGNVGDFEMNGIGSGNAMNVGIGTQGTGFGLKITNSGSGASLYVASGNVGIGTFLTATNLAVQGTFKVGNVNNTNNFSVDSSGNATVGTGNMTVAGILTVPSIRASSGSSGTLSIVGASGGVTDIVIIKTGSTDHIHVDPAGNVGISSVNPGQRLDVQGTVRFSGTLINTTSATGIGWSEHNATNQACNTTCGTSACVMALDIGTVGVINSGFVSCSDATADDCECAGP